MRIIMPESACGCRPWVRRQPWRELLRTTSCGPCAGMRAVYSAQFSADGKTVLTASDDKTARLWDVASGKELRALRGHEGGVGSAQFSADGKTVLTASDDKTARLWDVASGKELRALRGHEGAVLSAQFSADGKTVLTASGDKTARLWDCAECRPVDVLATEVARKLARELTENERRQFGLPPVRSPRS